MTNQNLGSVLEHIRKLVSAETDSPLPDRDLLERFIRDRDEAAFAALVQRHGPMVLGVCRRVLRHAQDAEDACQAAFLVLARKAVAIRKRESVGSFLHGVAYRVAIRLHRDVARRRARETAVEDVPQPEAAEVTWREVRRVLDEELRRLPERFQAPLLLCYVEGRTRDEAAQQLGWSPTTLRGRLERGRELLRARLTRRGVTLSAAILGATLTRHAAAALPATLFVRILRTTVAAAGAVPATVASLTEGVLKAMFLARLKFAAVVVLMIGFAGLGAVVLTGGPLPARPPAAGAAQAGDAPEEETPRVPRGPVGAAGGGDTLLDAAARSRNLAMSRLNLKNLALAMHNYLDMYHYFPAPAIYAGEAEGGGTAAGGGGIGPGMGSGGAPAKGGSGAGGMRPPGGMRGDGDGIMGSGGSGPPRGGPPPGGFAGSGGMSGGGAGSMRPGGPPGMGGMPMGGATGPGMGMGMPAMGGAGGAGGMGMGAGGPQPTAAQGKALLSWRVALLPFLGQNELYKQFRLNEPWDSPYNLRLLKKMPAVYAAPGADREAGMTFYQVFVGEHAAFEKHRHTRIADIIDGTSNTILIAEAGSAVPWTKPEDLHFAIDEPLPQLGGVFPDVFLAAFADGSVHTLSKKADPDTLRWAIMRDDGAVIDLAKIRGPATPREAELRRENEHLQQEVDRVRVQVDALQREKQVLLEESAETLRLTKENERLEQTLRQMREEAEKLRKEIQRLRQGRNKAKED